MTPRFDGGWIKAWRNSWEKDLSGNATLWALWNALLHLATWKETQILWNGKQRTLPPGTVVFGMHEFADRWHCSKSLIKKWLHHLHDTGRIVLETCPRGSLATICNWDIYQADQREGYTPGTNDANTEKLPRAIYESLNEEGNNKRKEERKEIEKSPPRTANALPPLARIWNSSCGTLPNVIACSTTRRKKAEARWREHPDETYWHTIVARILASNFCTGTNERGWRADFDFLIKPDTQNKVLEGKYDARGSEPTPSVDWDEVLRKDPK